MTVIAEDPTPKRSSAIRAEIRGHQANLSAAAERHDNHDYAQALAGLNAAKRELAGAEARERREATEARQRAKFKQDTGFASVGELIANRVATGQQRQIDRAFQAERTRQVAEVLYAPKPTPEDMGQAVLKQAREAAAAARKGTLRTDLGQALADSADLGDAA